MPPNLIDTPIDRHNLNDEKKYRFVKSNIELDELAEATQYMQELFRKEINAGNIPSSMSYSEWLKSLRTTLGLGGRVDKANRPKEPGSVKKIDLTQELLKTADMFSKLSESERATIAWMLKRLGKK